jgi:hypothetical protein
MPKDADPKADAAPPSAIVGTWELNVVELSGRQHC